MALPWRITSQFYRMITHHKIIINQTLMVGAVYGDFLDYCRRLFRVSQYA
ncbi:MULTISPECIES: L-alanine exporter AlaE [Enterobacterales]